MQPEGAAASVLNSGDKILEVDGVDFRGIHHNDAVEVLRNTPQSIQLLIERR